MTDNDLLRFDNLNDEAIRRAVLHGRRLRSEFIDVSLRRFGNWLWVRLRAICMRRAGPATKPYPSPHVAGGGSGWNSPLTADLNASQALGKERYEPIA